MRVLGIETSCDETAAAVVDDQGIRSNIVYSQLVHRQYGGVVPELASRQHLQAIGRTVEEALAGMDQGELDAVAATSSPGLAGALLVGNAFGQGLAAALNIKFVPVNHIEAHIYAAHLSHRELAPPYVALVVSGGHTSLFYVDESLELFLMGQTLDDAAGEALDKSAKMLGLPYPGGPEIESRAKRAEGSGPNFPVADLGPDSLDFSFSGLKTAVRNHLLKRGNDYLDRLTEIDIAGVCRGVQEAVIEALVSKAERALALAGADRLVVCGGVSVNQSLRQRFQYQADAGSYRVFFPRPELCTDNAAMVAENARVRLSRTGSPGTEISVRSRVSWPRFAHP